MIQRHKSFHGTDYDHFFKIIIIGDPSCGKTSLLLTVSSKRTQESVESTVGVDCRTRTVQHGEKMAKLQIWDTAGQEKFQTLTTSYY